MIKRALPLLLLMSACGPMTLASAERVCLDRARDAAGPRGAVAVGISGGKVRSRLQLDISTDALMGRDPSVVFDQCVLQKSGQMPSRPLAQRPDWQG